MNVLLISVLLNVATNDTGDAAVVERLKQVGKVFVTWQGEGKDRHVTRIDMRITGDRDAKDVSAAVKELGKLPKLEGVLLLGPAFTDEAIRELAAIKPLQDVQLHGTRVTDGGVAALVEVPHLRRLAFGGSGLTDKGLRDVARMKELRYLEITDAPLTNLGLTPLYGMKQLRRLQIVNSKASSSALQKLMESLPELESPLLERTLK